MLHRLIKRKSSFIFLLYILILFVFNACENPIMIKLLEPLAPEKGKGNGEQYTIIFNANGGEGTVHQPMKVKDGGSITLPNGNGLYNEGYEFEGWNTDAYGMGTDYKAGSSFTVTDNVTLYAKWIPIIARIAANMVYVPGGSFQMGNTGEEGYSNQKPVHTVTLTGFYMSKYEVTQAQYQAIMWDNPSYCSSNPASGEIQKNRPVECVNWYDAIVFCNRLSMAEGLNPAYSISGSTDPNVWGMVPRGSNTSTWDVVIIDSYSNGYRLPTEAQWEYAAKGGNGSSEYYLYSGSNTIEDVAWCYSNSDKKTHEVGKKASNDFGLYDMSGNVFEWCWDGYDGYDGYSVGEQTDPSVDSGYYRILRGGDFYNGGLDARTVYRYHHNPSYLNSNIGFRIVCPVDSTAPNHSYTVTFNSNGGSGADWSITVPAGMRITLPDRREFSYTTGYGFNGWNTNSSGTEKTYSTGSSFAVTNNVTLYAKWTPIDLARAEKVTLENSWYAVYRFDLPTGKTWKDYTGLKAFYMFEDDDLVNGVGRGALLMGPYQPSDFTLSVGSDSVPDKKLAIANYLDGKNEEFNLDKKYGSYDLWYSYNAGSLVNSLSGSGINAVANEWFTLDYDITGKNKSYDYDNANYPTNDSTGPFYFGVGITSYGNGGNIQYIRDVTLIGHNTADNIIATPVYFEKDGARWPAFIASSYGFPSDGYEEATRAMADGSKPATVPYGRPNKITFNAAGGTPVPTSPISMEYGDTINRPAAMTKPGYVFDNWYTSSDKSIYAVFPITVTDNVNLYANWISDVIIKQIADNMVNVPGGAFEMGDVKMEGTSNDLPVHTVTLSDFSISKYEVTQEQWTAVMGNNPSYSNPSNSGEVRRKLPVDFVNWYDAILFCNKLSIAGGLTPAYRISGSTDPAKWGAVPRDDTPKEEIDKWNEVEIVAGSNGYRLPTEAQWEYAAKGGKGYPGTYSYSGSNNAKDVAWYSGDDCNIHEVGLKDPNALGLYDMSGNVYEWCWDWYDYYSNILSLPQTDPMGALTGIQRVMRGGDWACNVREIRSAHRDKISPVFGNNTIGFRLVRPN